MNRENIFTGDRVKVCLAAIANFTTDLARIDAMLKIGISCLTLIYISITIYKSLKKKDK